jgi:hypothetical protein
MEEQEVSIVTLIWWIVLAMDSVACMSAARNLGSATSILIRNLSAPRHFLELFLFTMHILTSFVIRIQ